jgi:hypothetical protein
MLSTPYALRQTPPGYARQLVPLVEQLRDVIRRKHYSLRTEDVYVDWLRRFIAFCAPRDLRECGAPDVEAFLTGLAVQANVAASTQN